MAGGVLVGVVLGKDEYATTFAWLVGMLCLWFVVALTRRAPACLASKIGSLQGLGEDARGRLLESASSRPGVHEVSVYEFDRVADLEVEKDFDDTRRQALLSGR